MDAITVAMLATGDKNHSSKKVSIPLAFFDINY
jgi:hypothetical protein